MEHITVLQETTTSLLSVWATDKTLHVIEIRDVDRRLNFDLKSLIADALQDANVSNYKIKVIFLCLS